MTTRVISEIWDQSDFATNHNPTVVKFPSCCAFILLLFYLIIKDGALRETFAQSGNPSDDEAVFMNLHAFNILYDVTAFLPLLPTPDWQPSSS